MPGGVHVQDLAPRPPRLEDLHERVEVEPRPLAVGERLRERGEMGAHHDLVRELGVHSGPHRLAEVLDHAAEDLEEGPASFEGAGPPADHDPEGAGGRARLPSRHRGVEHVDAPLREPGADPFAHRRGNGRHVDVDLDRAPALEDAARSGGDVLDTLPGGQAREDDRGLRRHPGGLSGRHRALVDEGPHAGRDRCRGRRPDSPPGPGSAPSACPCCRGRCSRWSLSRAWSSQASGMGGSAGAWRTGPFPRKPGTGRHPSSNPPWFRSQAAPCPPPRRRPGGAGMQGHRSGADPRVPPERHDS